ncbi:MAG: hypothetical protein EZS28_032730, partial [Streblomastix strix]
MVDTSSFKAESGDKPVKWHESEELTKESEAAGASKTDDNTSMFLTLKTGDVKLDKSTATWKKETPVTLLVKKEIEQGQWHCEYKISGTTGGKQKFCVGLYSSASPYNESIILGSNEDSAAFYGQGVLIKGGSTKVGDKGNVGGEGDGVGDAANRVLPIKDGDTVSIEVDMKEKLATFFINGNLQSAVITNIPSKFRFGFSASKSGAKVEILKLTEKESATYNPRTSDMWIPYGAGGSAGASAWTISKRSEIAYSFTYARWNQNRGLTAIVDKLITQGIWRVGLIIRGAWAPNTKWQPVIGICKDGWAKDGATALGKDEDTIGYYSQGVTTQAGRMLQGNKEWKDGDRLDVELDMRERIVYFFVKGRQGHVVYTNVPPQVRVGVSLSAAGATAQVALLSDVKCSFQPRATDWWEPWGGVNVPNKTSLFKVPKIPDKIVISQMMAHFNDAVKYTTMVDFIVQTGS